MIGGARVSGAKLIAELSVDQIDDLGLTVEHQMVLGASRVAHLVLNGQDDPRVAAEIADLRGVGLGAEKHVVVLDPAPHDRHLRKAVLADGDDVGEGIGTEEYLGRCWKLTERSHVSSLSSRSTPPDL